MSFFERTLVADFSSIFFFYLFVRPYVRRSPKRTIIVRLPAGEPITSAGSGAIRTFVFILSHFSAPASATTCAPFVIKTTRLFSAIRGENEEIRARYVRAGIERYHALALNLSYCFMVENTIAINEATS